jgi:hypothetical protein
MYVEEYYNTTDELSITDTSTFNSDKHDQKRLIKEFKQLDRGYQRLKKGSLRKTTVEFYSTPSTPNSRIRNAITGERYRWRVGKLLEESLFFTAIIATGEIVNGPYTLYYDTPEQYEKHQSVVVRDDVKHNWYTRYYAAKSKLCI